MPEQDLPNLDEEVTQLPTEIRQDMAELGKRDLFFFAKGILGYKDMTKQCHGPLCVFATQNPSRFKGMLMPRDHFKSSVISIAGSMQRVVRNPDERILLANESSTNAERFLRAIREHAEANRIFRALYSSVIPKDITAGKTGRRWNDSELQFNREWRGPEPTIDTIGMTGAYTSRHYTHITVDDPISEDAIKSEKVMEDTIQRIKSFLSLLSKPEQDTYWIVGTRWALHDVYSWHMRNYGSRMVWLVRAALEDGQPIFPELMSLDTLALKRSTYGEYKFSCLYMNNPRNEELQDLNVNDLKFWQWHESEEFIILSDTDGEIRRVRVEDLDITATVDLAPAERATSDRNAVTVVGITKWGEAIVLEAWGRRCTPIELMNQIFTFHKRYRPRVWGIEGVAYQKAFKYFLKEQMNKEGLYLRIQELTATGKKEIRVRGLQPVMATGRMFVNPAQHLLRNEMADFPLGEFDDVLDSLSMHLQLWRGQMSPEHWERLRKEERRLIKRVMNQHRGSMTLPLGRTKLNFDLFDDESDDVPGVQLPEIEDYTVPT